MCRSAGKNSCVSIKVHITTRIYSAVASHIRLQLFELFCSQDKHKKNQKELAYHKLKRQGQDTHMMIIIIITNYTETVWNKAVSAIV